MISNVQYTKKPNIVQQVNILDKYCHCFRSKTLKIRPDRNSLNYLAVEKFNNKKISIEIMKDPIHPN